MNKRVNGYKRFWGIVLMICLTVSLTACGGSKTQETTSTGSQQESASASAAATSEPAPETIKLKVADIYPSTHYVPANSLMVWTARVSELTDNQVQFDIYPSQQMGSSADMLDIMSKGIADIGYVPFPYFSSRMPLITGAGAISGTWSNCSTGNPAVWAVATSSPVLENDFLSNDIRPILPFANQTFQLLTNKKLVTSLDEIKGLKIRSSGGVMDKIIASLGAIPVQIPVTELYEAMARGTVDGTLISCIAADSNKINEASKYVTTGVNVSGGVFGYVINEDVWQTLPQNVQEAMNQASTEALTQLGETMDSLEQEALEAFKNGGLEVHELSQDEQKKWILAQANVEADWISDMDGKGLPGAQVLQSLRDHIEP
ncbi:MAG: TRAP-type transport system periplasmic protein [Clostridiales bacterium]|nr:TRAP-type transport system periplasmic protein [Clostridiales bacterium]